MPLPAVAGFGQKNRGNSQLVEIFPLGSGVWLSLFGMAPGVFAKTLYASFQPDCSSIEAIRSDDPDDSLLCPVRAYSALLNRVAEFPGNRSDKSLWDKVGKASILFLTNTLKVLVRDSKMSISIFDDVTAGPHHFRKLAASYSAKLFRSPNDDARLRKKLGCSEKVKF